MKILVTGGAGYIGARLVDELLAAKHNVLVVDNFMYNQNSLLANCHDKKLTIVRGDARDKLLIKKLMGGIDVIIPLACLTGASICAKDPVAAKTTNFDAIKIILKNRSRRQVLIYPSTQSVYGHQDVICTEETKVKPLSLYSKLKVKVENLLQETENFII